MKKLLRSSLLMFSLLIAACGGGGGGTGSNEPPPPTQPIQITLQLSIPETPPEGTIIRSAKAIITLPTNVTVGTVGGDLDIEIPPAITGTKLAAIVGNELTVTIFGTDNNVGIRSGIIAYIRCSYTGASPTFSQPAYEIAGAPPGEIVNFDIVPNTSVALTVQ